MGMRQQCSVRVASRRAGRSRSIFEKIILVRKKNCIFELLASSLQRIKLGNEVASKDAEKEQTTFKPYRSRRRLHRRRLLLRVRFRGDLCGGRLLRRHCGVGRV